MSHHVTTFNGQGEAVFSSNSALQQNTFNIPLGKLTLLYTTHFMPADISGESDIDQFAKDSVNGLPPASPCPSGGTSAAMIQLAPGAVSPKRRTLTLGVFFVAEGIVRVTLDSGEDRELRAGDVVVLRAALHTFKNETPGEGWARLIVFAQSVDEVEVNGRKLNPVWL